VPSDEGEDMEEDDAGEDEDEEKQIRILQETTGMPREAFDGNISFCLWRLSNSWM
jgi:U3 small nucleolar RNA-associated protein 14